MPVGPDPQMRKLENIWIHIETALRGDGRSCAGVLVL